VLTVLKSGSLSLLESSGSVQACNGIALPLPLHERVADLEIHDKSEIESFQMQFFSTSLIPLSKHSLHNLFHSGHLKKPQSL